MLQLPQLNDDCSVKDIYEQVKVRYSELLIAYINNNGDEIATLRNEIEKLWRFEERINAAYQPIPPYSNARP